MKDAADIRPLTALRFFAALWVVLFHFWPKLDVAATPTFVAKGYLGVELFFILSGFILCHVYRTQVEEGRFRYGSFLWARLARVYPLHIATLVGLGGLALVATKAGVPIDKNILDWPSLPANLLMVHAWGFAPQAGWNHPSWSISAEWFAYLSFPLFAWGALALKNRPLLAVALSGGFLAALYWGFERWAGFPLTEATIRFGFLRIVPCFAFGAALHSLWRARPATSAPRAIANVGTALALSVIGAAFGLPDTLIVLSLGLLILFLADAAKAGAGIGERRQGVYLGEISYSVYMLCVPWKILFINGAARALGIADEKLPPLVWIAGIIGLVLLAAASYHLIERPARAAMKGLEQKWGARRLSAARI